jgi:hypothetical protein
MNAIDQKKKKILLAYGMMTDMLVFVIFSHINFWHFF